MNIRCPQCQTVFRVNPERIPPQGVRARCARCGGTFHVDPPSAQTRAPEAPAAAAPRQPAPEPRPAAQPRPAAPAPRATGAATQQQSQPQQGESTTATTSRPARPFGARDPKARAERLARALVSDIVAYHPERRDASLEKGTLRTEFREEIMKSWEEYVAQVGEPMAKSTPYFRNALNDILAKGAKLF